MSFALKKSKLWRYIKGIAIATSPFKAKNDNSKNQIEKIYA